MTSTENISLQERFALAVSQYRASQRTEQERLKRISGFEDALEQQIMLDQATKMTQVYFKLSHIQSPNSSEIPNYIQSPNSSEISNHIQSPNSFEISNRIETDHMIRPRSPH